MVNSPRTLSSLLKSAYSSTRSISRSSPASSIFVCRSPRWRGVDRTHAKPQLIWSVKNAGHHTYLYVINHPSIHSTLLLDLKELKEFHLWDFLIVPELFDQKQRYNRTDLEIFYRGCLLKGLPGPAIHFFSGPFGPEAIVYMAEHLSKLVDKIPGQTWLSYSMKRYTDLNEIVVHQPVQDTERFLDLLKTFSNLTSGTV